MPRRRREALPVCGPKAGKRESREWAAEHREMSFRDISFRKEEDFQK
jgi:hypothetical protein